MHRIDTATSAVDLFGAGKNGFRNGNKAEGISATDLTAEFFNDVQENLARLIEAAGIALVKGDYTQLLTALRSAGLFQTPAQFDNSTKAATTEFVQRALGNRRGYANLAVNNTTLLAADAGRQFNITSVAVTTYLPLLSEVQEGTAYHFKNTGGATNNTVDRSGADVILANNVPITSVNVQNGDDLTVIKIAGAWVAVGSAALKYSATFGASLAAPGYQKLPSGLIVQWGSVVTSASASVAVTFPVAFTSAAYVALTGCGQGSSVSATFDNLTATGMNVSGWTPSTGARAAFSSVFWGVIGK